MMFVVTKIWYVVIVDTNVCADNIQPRLRKIELKLHDFKLQIKSQQHQV